MLQGRHEHHGRPTNDEFAEFFGVSPRTIDNWSAAP
jgi:hypothetical protein